MIKNQRQYFKGLEEQNQEITQLSQIEKAIEQTIRDVDLLDQLIQRKRILERSKEQLRTNESKQQQQTKKILEKKLKQLRDKEEQYETMKKNIVSRTYIVKQKEKETKALKQTIMSQETELERLKLQKEEIIEKQQKKMCTIAELNKAIKMEALKKIELIKQLPCKLSLVSSERSPLLTQIANMQRVNALLRQACVEMIN